MDVDFLLPFLIIGGGMIIFGLVVILLTSPKKSKETPV